MTEELPGVPQMRHAQEVHFYLHLPDPLRVIMPERKSGAPVTAILTIGDSLKMPAKVSIDDAAATAQVLWVDDKGDTDAPRPDGALVSFASSDTTIATVTPDATNPDLAHITPVAEGSAQVVPTITDTAGAPLMEPDGVTPFSVAPGDFQVVAGAAVGAEFAIKA